MELVSVVIPTYNRALKVIEAIDSVLCQSYPFLEIIVIDDGSTDNTQSLLCDYSGKVTYIYKENGGVSSARNIGIQNSTGDLIAFLDSDDTWVENKIEKQVEWFRQNPEYGMVLTDVFYVDSSVSIIEKTNRRSSLPINGFILDDVLLQPSLIPSSVLVRRAVFDEVGFFDESLKTAEDLDLHLRVAEKHKIGLIEQPLVYFLRGEEGLSQAYSTYGDYVFVLERFLKNNSDKCSAEIYKKSLYNVYLTASDGKYWRGECIPGLVYAIRSLRKSTSFKQFIQSCKNILKFIKYIGRAFRK